MLREYSGAPSNKTIDDRHTLRSSYYTRNLAPRHNKLLETSHKRQMSTRILQRFEKSAANLGEPFVFCGHKTEKRTQLEGQGLKENITMQEPVEECGGGLSLSEEKKEEAISVGMKALGYISSKIIVRTQDTWQQKKLLEKDRA